MYVCAVVGECTSGTLRTIAELRTVICGLLYVFSRVSAYPTFLMILRFTYVYMGYVYKWLLRVSVHPRFIACGLFGLFWPVNFKRPWALTRENTVQDLHVWVDFGKERSRGGYTGAESGRFLPLPSHIGRPSSVHCSTLSLSPHRQSI